MQIKRFVFNVNKQKLNEAFCKLNTFTFITLSTFADKYSLLDL